MNTALILVDIQNDYFPGGKMEVPGSLDAARKAGELLALFRQEGWPVVFIQHVSDRPGATFFLPETPGSEIYPVIRPRAGEPVLRKHYPNSFRDTDLLGLLRDMQVSRLVICGMMTQMCIDATARAAFDYGFECLLAADACAARELTYGGRTIPADHVQGSFLAALHGIYGRVLKTGDILSRLQQKSA